MTKVSDKKYILNAEILGAMDINADGAFTALEGGTAGVTDTELSSGINPSNIISAINSAYAAGAGNEPGAPANSVQYNNGSSGFAGSEYWLISEISNSAVSTISGSFQLTGSDSSLSVSGPSTFTGLSSFAAGQSIDAGQSISGQGALGVASVGALSVSSLADVTVEAGVGNIILEMADSGGANEVSFNDASSTRVAGIDSDGNADFGGTLDVTGLSALAATTVSTTLGVTGISSLDGGIDVASKFTVGTGGAIAVDINKFTVSAAGAVEVASTLDVTGESTLASAAVTDLTSGRVVLAGTAGAIEDSANLTFDGSDLKALSGDISASADLYAGGALTVQTTAGITGAATLGNTLSVAGLSTLSTVNASGLVAMAAAATVGTTLGVTGITTMDGALNVDAAISGSSTMMAASGYQLVGTNASGDRKVYTLTVGGGLLLATEGAAP